MKVEALIVHHSASRRETTPATIAKWHTDPKPEGRGWRKVGYHWLIDHHGITHVGRETHETGAHAPPNKGRLGVCVIGDNTVPGREWNDAQWEALERLESACKVVWPKIKVLAHNETKATACPGISGDEVRRGIARESA